MGGPPNVLMISLPLWFLRIEITGISGKLDGNRDNVSIYGLIVIHPLVRTKSPTHALSANIRDGIFIVTRGRETDYSRISGFVSMASRLPEIRVLLRCGPLIGLDYMVLSQNRGTPI